MIKVIVMISKLPEISFEQFVRYYEDIHAPLINELLPFYKEYRRKYLTGPVFEGRGEAGCDVITELEFASQDAYDAWLAALRNPEVTDRIRADESHFLQSDKTRMWTVLEHADDLSHMPVNQSRP
jgi:uncharacterized protein (TIGR02118 family)